MSCLLESSRLHPQSVAAAPSERGPGLLAYRGHWAQHLERLWFAADFAGFLGALQPLELLLKQPSLERESAAWMLNLLERTGVVEPAEAAPEAQLAWLVLATKALVLEEALATYAISAGAELWWRWIQEHCGHAPDADIRCLRQAARFLEGYFQRRGDWDRCATICELCIE